MAIENWKLFANTVILDVGSELVADDKITLTRTMVRQNIHTLEEFERIKREHFEGFRLFMQTR
jgi:hypothetical protein